jgi:hypothetical protein
MKQRLDWIGDPSLHLIALTTALVGAVLALHSGGWRRPATRETQHPPGCHACSVCPPEAAAARDAYLIRTGSIQPPDAAE